VLMKGLGERDRSSLECPHCGDVAAFADPETNRFEDGQGGDAGCESCGFPGSVSCDAESDPYWVMSDLESATCNRDDCVDCSIRAEEHYALKQGRKEGEAC
jgi:hypothetical protein